MEENLQQDLINKCLKGDSLAQYRLFDLYVKAMYNTVLRLVENKMEAEDIVQEGFVKAFGKLDQFKGNSTFGAWLKRIMVNQALDSLKRKSLEIVPFPVNETAFEDDNSFEENNDLMPSPAVVNEQILKLPKGCRMIFTLYQIEGYEQKQVAEMLDVSLSTVKTQYRRARLLLKERLMTLKDER
ncbi:RNA polymerase sigma factor [Owenweeksia hongkongensis]|uniref:RNA polymerase sigma factor n=1 Tax=Owenweeksia hongkongensis TaxID=253245 RepID=UPI003A93DBCB